MQLKIVILLVAIILMSSGASALKFDEKITVNGGGYMHSQTNTEQSSDLIEGHGAQNYHRSLTSQLGLSSLASEYSLKSDNLPNVAYFPNRYQISMKSPTGLRHTISVYGSSGEGVENLSSVSRIAFDPAIAPPSSLQTSEYALSTSYEINGNGSLSEAITDLSQSQHPTNIAETSIVGGFTVNSRLTNSLTLPARSEAQSQSAKIDSVIPVSDMPQQTESSIRIADLETMLNRGLITQDDYLNKMEDLLTTGRITADQYASSLKSAFDSGLITLSYVDYSAMQQKASSATLKDLNTLVNKTLVTPEEYLIALKQMFDDNRITEVDYLSALRATKAATKISEVQYPTYKMITLNEMESKYVDKGIDWTTYSSRLNAMLSLGLINQDDYTAQIQRSSNDTISTYWELLSKCLINKTDFSDNLKVMKLEGRIDDNRYNAELEKLRIFDISNCP